MPVERLDEHLDQVEDAELRFGAVNGHTKRERRIGPVDDARARRVEPRARVEKRGGRLRTRGERREELAHNLLLLLLWRVTVKLEEALQGKVANQQ